MLRNPYGLVKLTASRQRLRRHAATSEPIPCPSLRAKRSNPGAAVRPSRLLAPRMLWPLDCFVARAPRNDGWVAADRRVIARQSLPFRSDIRDVADAAFYLLSPQSRFVTGQELHVNGGRYVRQRRR